MEGEDNFAFRFGRDNNIGGEQLINGVAVVFEDEDQLQLGSLEYEKDYSAVFPNGPNTFGNDYYGQLEIIFREFIYFQGAHFRTDDLCRENTLIEAGRDENAYPLVCEADYAPFFEVNKCVRLNMVPSSICEHDMDSEDSKCYRCQRGYGNVDDGPCSACSANCLACKGSGNDNCIYCAIGYGFDGSGCTACVAGVNTFDANLNSCQAVKQHHLDMWGDASTLGELKLFFKPLNEFASSSIHIETFDNKYWLTEISKNYYVVRDYADLPRHRKVAVTIEFLVVDLTNLEFVFIAVDGKYVKQINAWGNDYTMTSNMLGTGYTDWNFKIAIVDWHSAATMQLGVVGLFNDIQTNIWIRNVQVDFFGCFFACKDCWVDNSPLHCTECEDGYYLEDFQCKACDSSCERCSGTADNCISCFEGQYLKEGVCTDKCGLGYYIDDGNVCYSCPVECTQCLSAANCISCQTGYYLDGGACLPCSGDCLTCRIAEDNCTSCASPLLLQSGSCVNECSSNYYLQSTTCIECPNGCATCDKDTCLTCLPSYRFRGNVCANPCGDGYYIVDDDNCGACDTKCTKCNTSAGNCTECHEGYYLDGNTCTACVSPCATCSSASACVSCVSETYLKDAECLESCGDGYYGKNRICHTCPGTCSLCTPDECTACEAGYYLREGECFDSCVEGFFEYNDSLCCPNSCDSCATSTECLTCKPGHYLENKACHPCKSVCSACEDQFDNCTGCIEEYYKIGSECVQACPDEEYYIEDFECLPCDSSCKTCSGPEATDCLSCFELYIYYIDSCFECGGDGSPFDLESGECVDRCGDGRRFTVEDVDTLYSYNECDDGNNLDGDGCSALCTIEDDFACEGGSPVRPDICRETIPPTATLVKYDDLNFAIKFSEPVRINEGITLQAALSIYIPEYDSRDRYRAKYDTAMTTDIETVDIEMVYDETFYNRTLTIDLNRPIIKDYAGNNLITHRLASNITFVIPERAAPELYTNVTSVVYNYAYYAGASLSPVLGTYLSSAILFSYSDVLRASYYLYLNGRANADVLYLLYGMRKINGAAAEVVPMDSDQSRRLLGMDGRAISTDIDPVRKFMQDVVAAPHRIFTNLSFSLLLASLIILYVSKLFLDHGISSKTTALRKWTVFWATRFAFFMGVLNLIPVLFSCSINLVLLSADTTYEYGLLVFSGLAILGTFYLIVVCYYMVEQPMLTLWHPSYYYRYGMLYSEFKLDKKLTKTFLVLYLAKNALFGCLLGFLIFNGDVQTLLLLLLNGIYLLILVKTLPYINIYLNILAIAVESIETVILLLFTMNNYVEDTNTTFINTVSYIIAILFTCWVTLAILRLLFTVFLRLKNEFKYVKIVLIKNKVHSSSKKHDEIEGLDSSQRYLSSEAQSINLSDSSGGLLKSRSSKLSSNRKSTLNENRSQEKESLGNVDEEDRNASVKEEIGDIEELDKDMMKIDSDENLKEQDEDRPYQQKDSNVIEDIEDFVAKDMIRVDSDEPGNDEAGVNKPTREKGGSNEIHIEGFEDDMMKVDDNEI